MHGTTSLLRAMDTINCTQIIFSSSATVYGEPVYVPYDDYHRTAPIYPYAQSIIFVFVIVSLNARLFFNANCQNSFASYAVKCQVDICALERNI